MMLRNISLLVSGVFLGVLFLSGSVIISDSVSAAEGGQTKMSSFSQQKDWWICFGTQSSPTTEPMKDNNVPKSEGIYAGQFNAETGAIDEVKLVEPMQSSNFFAVNKEKNLLYVSGLRKKEDGQNNVYAYRFDPKSGQLTYLNHQSTNGNGVCHVSISKDGKYLAASNYSSGDFSIFPLDEQGRIEPLSGFMKKPGGGPDPFRQKSAYGHSAYFLTHQGKTRVLMCDLGSDKVYIQLLDEKTGKIVDDPDVPVLTTPPGSGPRHLSWLETKDGNIVVFVLNELDSTLSAFELNFSGPKLTMNHCGDWSTIPLPLRNKLTDETTRVDHVKYLYSNKTAEIEILPLAKPVLYASNRGHNTLAVFDIEAFLQPKKGATPKLIQYQSTFGTFPRFFTSDPTGSFMVASNKKTGTIYVFRINKDGKLTPVNQEPTKVAWCIAMAFFPVEK